MRVCDSMPVIPHATKRYMKYAFGHRYRLASMTCKSRTFDRMVQKMMFEGDDMTVIPKDKVVTRRVDLDIEVDDAGDRTVLPSDVVKNVFDRTEHIFIMNFCICRHATGCEDFPIDHGCVFLGKGIEKIPPEFGRRATPEEAKAYIDECGELGLVHIIGRNKLDTIWLNTGDKKDLMTICNCCPCCCLWNVARKVSEGISATYHRLEGVEVIHDSEGCNGCGRCAEICFTKAITIEEGKARIDQSKCRACGRCIEMCAKDAITITFDDTVVDREVERIHNLVNL